MATFSKILIMLVRGIALISIVLGVLIWTGQMPNLLPAHIGLGFLLTISVALLGILALVKRAFPVGALALIAAIVLPWIGLRQLTPLTFMHLGPIQIAHILVVVAALGLAEASYSAIRKAS